MDRASSSDPAVQRQLDRLSALGPGADILGLERITRLLARLGNPEARLPPVFHVAGTNGKGSTCAFLRAALEAAGHRVHVYTSPHLVRFNERIRVAGRLIDDAALASLLAEVLDAGGDIGASFFEVTTAAAFLAFARTPADACVIEVGLGGRLDATNVVPDPAACGIAQLGLDHQAFLGNSLAAIAAEKAGIAKSGRPLVTFDYGDELNAVVRSVADRAGAVLHVEGVGWQHGGNARLRRVFHHGPGGAAQIMTPWPVLAGDHQVANLALAVAMLRAQDRVAVPVEALKAAPLAARWPARMQRLGEGPLTAMLPGAEIWLDGAHNPAAAQVVAGSLAEIAQGRKAHLILGILANKDSSGIIAPFADIAASLTAVPVPAHESHPIDILASRAVAEGIEPVTTAADIAGALSGLRPHTGAAPLVMILGSLYLAGTVLAANEEQPD